MSKRIITISREFGSGGRYLGERIAQKLGWDYYDKEMIAKVAEKTGLSQKYIEAKQKEWDEYKTQITNWEVEKYLYKV